MKINRRDLVHGYCYWRIQMYWGWKCV